MFSDDFQGKNGRKKKTLWLTEVAYGGNDGGKVSAFVAELMNAKDGLANRDPGPTGFGYVERVSWFSEFFFPSFTVSGIDPKPNEMWSSSLFNPYGGLSPVGTEFFKHCASVDAPSPQPTPGPPTPPTPSPPTPPPPPPTPPAPTPAPAPPTPAPPAPTPAVGPTKTCPVCTPAQCKAENCNKGAPYECTDGSSKGGCSSDPKYWPNAASSCSGCCNSKSCP